MTDAAGKTPGTPPAMPVQPSTSRNLWDKLPFRTSRGIIAATILLFVISALVQPESLSASAMAGMIPFASVLALVALGQTLVIQQGGIDLSVPGVVSLSGVIVSYYSSNSPGMNGSSLGIAIVCHHDGMERLRARMVTAMMSLETRKPVALPDALRDKIEAYQRKTAGG